MTLSSTTAELEKMQSEDGDIHGMTKSCPKSNSLDDLENDPSKKLLPQKRSAVDERDKAILALMTENAMLKAQVSLGAKSSVSLKEKLEDRNWSREHSQSNFPIRARSMPLRPSRRIKRLSVKEWVDENDALDDFVKTVAIAISQSKTEKPVAVQEAFRQFLLLSLKPKNISTSITNAGITQGGSRYLDEFQVHAADVLDLYPSQKRDPSLFDPAGLLPFCFPNGVKARLIPQVALERAKQKGWVGRAADKYHVVVFTNGEGVARQGVAITVTEEVNSGELLSRLSVLRELRQASRIICRWWKRVVAKRREPVRAHSYSGSRSERLKRGTRIGNSFYKLFNKDELQRAARGDKSTHPLIKSTSWDGSRSTKNYGESGHAHTVELSDWSSVMSSDGGHSRSSADTESDSSSDSTKDDELLSFKRVQDIKEKMDSSSKEFGVLDVVHLFIKTSPIPFYNQVSKDGIWKKAKLKAKRESNEHIVIIEHVPVVRGESSRMEGSNDAVNSSIESLRCFKRECACLAQVLSNLDFRARKGANSTQRFRVSAVCFRELDVKCTNYINETRIPVNQQVTPSAVTTSSTSLGKVISAMEAYEEMIAGKKLGDACLVEKCYVLMGSKEPALCFSALQVLVDDDRRYKNMNEVSEKSIRKLSRAISVAVAISKTADDFSLGSKSQHTVLSENKLSLHRRSSTATRLKLLKFIQDRAMLSRTESKIKLAQSETEQVYGARKFFELNLPSQNTDSLRIPLPLPQVPEEFGLSTLLLRIDSEWLMKLLQLLVLERSVLLVGECSAEVTSSVCALLALLKPYKWRGTFLPQLPLSMLDMVHSPVPFVMGMVGNGERDLKAILADNRVVEAREEGMVIVNINSGCVSAKIDDDMVRLFASPPRTREKLQCLQSRLKEHCDKIPLSQRSLRHFVQNGFRPKHSLTLHSVRKLIFTYMQNLAGDLSDDQEAWKRYGFGSGDDGDNFRFSPDKYCDQICAELEFRREMSHTQMFASFVHARRDEDMEKRRLRGVVAGPILARWLQKQCIERRKLLER